MHFVFFFIFSLNFSKLCFPNLELEKLFSSHVFSCDFSKDSIYKFFENSFFEFLLRIRWGNSKRSIIKFKSNKLNVNKNKFHFISFRLNYKIISKRMTLENSK